MHRRTPTLVTTAALVAGLAACAHRGANTQLLADVPTSELQWSGTIRPVQQQSALTQPSSRTAINGTAIMTQDRQNTGHSRIDLTISAPSGNTLVNWALVPGRCGTGQTPVLPINNFQPVELPSSGRGEISASVPYTFPTQGSYHLAVYNGNHASMANVVACANLKLERK